MLTQIIVALIVLATSIPVGMMLEKATRDEIKFRRNFSKIAIILSTILILVSLIFNIENKLNLIFTFFYICVVCLFSLKKFQKR